MNSVGVPWTPLASAAVQVDLDPGQNRIGLAIAVEPSLVETKLAGVAKEIARGQRRLPVEQPMLHFPELALLGGGFGRPSGMQRVRVDLDQREVSKDTHETVAELCTHHSNLNQCSPRIGAFIVAVDDELKRRVELTERYLISSGPRGLLPTCPEAERSAVAPARVPAACHRWRGG